VGVHRGPVCGRLAAVRARDLAVQAPVLETPAPAVDALRAMTASGLPGLVVRSAAGFVVVPASQVLRVALPRYVLDDPSLARVWGDESADELTARLAGLTVTDLVAALERPDRPAQPTVDPDATSVEIAAVLSSARVPLVAVVDGDDLLGVVTVNGLVHHLVG